MRIGDQYYSRGELQDFFRERLNEFQDPAAAHEVRTALLEDFIEERLLLAEAARRGVAVDPASVQAVAGSLSEPAEKDPATIALGIEESLKIQRYVNEHVFRSIQVTEEECRQYYEEHPGDFIRNDVVHLREILVGTPDLAEKIQSQLRASRNKNFAELARLHSKAPSAVHGGDLGRFQRGDLPEKLERTIFRLAPGTVSKTITTEFGYHTFFVEEKILAHQLKFYEAKSEIEERLLLERQRNALNQEIASLLQRTPVEIYRNNLGFNYSGARFSSPGGTRP
ncbi:MAG: peptidyl-prolyl cis-trans isomerase [Acidobacteriota bacterium]